MIKNLTKTEMELLEFFTRKPEEKIHLRGLSQETSLAYSSVRNAAKSLEEKGLLESDERSKMTFYSSGGEGFRQLKKLLNLEKIEESGLVEFLEKELRPEAIVLFGSYLEGRDDEESDIDIAVVGGRDREPDLEKFEEELDRDIHLVKVEDLENENREFRNSLANGYVLQGYLEVV